MRQEIAMKMKVTAEFVADESGSAAVEYIIVVLVVSTAAIVTMKSVGDVVMPLFEQITDALKAAAL